MNAKLTQGRKGSAVLEMALVLPPLLLAITATCDLSRAMWTFHTLASAVKTGTRLAAVHGSRCKDASEACPISVAQVVAGIQAAALGLDPASLQLTLTSGPQTVSCNAANDCSSNQSAWPAAPSNAVGQPLTIVGMYSFQSVLAALFPAGGVNFAARSTEVIEF